MAYSSSVRTQRLQTTLDCSNTQIQLINLTQSFFSSLESLGNHPCFQAQQLNDEQLLSWKAQVQVTLPQGSFLCALFVPGYFWRLTKTPNSFGVVLVQYLHMSSSCPVLGLDGNSSFSAKGIGKTFAKWGSSCAFSGLNCGYSFWWWYAGFD